MIYVLNKYLHLVVMRSIRAAAVFLTILFTFCSCFAFAENLIIERVEFSGNRRIDSDALHLRIQSKVGVVERSLINSDVRSLYELGFFDQVESSLVFQENVRVLRFSVREKPAVRKVLIEGNDNVQDKVLAESLKLEPGRFYDRAKISALQRNAVSLYQSRGYLDVEVDHRVVPALDNQVDVVFQVREGDLYKVRKLKFQGLDIVDPSDLASEIQTKRYKWWNSWLFGTGKLNEEVLQNDLIIIRQNLLNQGLVDGEVGAPIIEKQDRDLIITIPIQEGEQYRVRSVDIVGDPLESSNKFELLGRVKIKENDVFSADKTRKDSFKLSEAYSDEGFAFVNINPLTNIDRSSRVVDIKYEVSRGSPVTVNKINISGNDKTYDRIIRREMRLDEGMSYSGTKLRRSETLLKRLGYFEEVSITTLPVTAGGTRDDLVDLNVRVREGSTGRFTVGAGYSTSDGAIFNTRITEDNVLGTGRRLDLNVDYGTQRDNIILSLEDRRLFDPLVSGSIEGFHTNREFLDFSRRTSGAGLGFGYPLEEIFGESLEDLHAGLKYEYSAIEISNIRDSAAEFVKRAEGDSTVSSVTPRISRNTIDNPLDPTKGSRQSIGVEIAGLGGKEDFYLLDVRHSGFYPVFETPWGEIVGSWRFNLAIGESNTSEPFPLFRRFFPGGINSVRGFRARSLGPLDENGERFGGSKLFVNNFDLTFPLISAAGIRGVFFFDFGEAFSDEQSIRFADMRKSYGAGVRWNSPMGPIRVEFGFPLDRQEGERSMVPMFSFGAPL